jgi:hypothetical protein
MSSITSPTPCLKVAAPLDLAGDRVLEAAAAGEPVRSSVTAPALDDLVQADVLETRPPDRPGSLKRSCAPRARTVFARNRRRR